MNLSKLIYNVLDEQQNENRAYIGASSIGNPCERSIWYGLNRPDDKEISPKLKMTFEIGRKLELIIVNVLLNQFAADTQRHLFCKEYELFQGSCDAVFFDPNLKQDFLLEIKTANDSSFNTFKKKGIRLWYPEYYDQVQAYMGMSGVHKCYLLAINKNTSELHDELVLFDEYHYDRLIMKARRIGEAKEEPARINNSPSYFKCKMCFYRKICHAL